MKNANTKKPAAKGARRRSATVAALTLALGTAVYLNWSFARQAPLTVTADADGSLTEVSADTSPETVAVFDELSGEPQGEQTANKNYGEAQLVSVSKDSGAEFFEQARLSRAKARDETLDDIEKALKKAQLTDEEKKELSAELSAQLSGAAVESDLETLIKAKGFADCVAVVNGSSISITVMTENDALTAAEVTRIRDLVLDKCRSATAQDITITEVK